MIVWYVVLEWRLWRAGVERVYGNKRVVLRGRRWRYSVAAFTVGFLGFTGVFLGLMSYAGIEYPNIVCWLAGSLLSGGINLVNIGARLKYFEFDHE